MTILRWSLVSGRRAQDFERSSSALFEALLTPASRHLEGVTRLVLVPDAFLWQVPFGVLLDRRSDRLAIQVWEISVAPSAASRPASSAPAEADHALPARALLIGTGEPSPEKYPGLDRLPEVEGELREIASLYPGTRASVGDQATRGAFLEGVEKADLVHFAGHAVWNERAPALSALLFAEGGEAREAGEVYLYELLGLDLSRVRLVVLGGCSTGKGSGSRSEGPPSLSLPFLSGGARAVVGALWNIADRPAAAFLADLHRRYAKTGRAAEALMGAKRAWLQGTSRRLDAVRVWAPFEVVEVIEPPVRPRRCEEAG